MDDERGDAALDPAMDLPSQRFADAVVLAPAGRINHANYEELKAGLWPFVERCTASGDRLVLDLSRVEYISSAGLLVLMLATKQARAQGGTVVVAALQTFVKEIFNISRFATLLEIHPTVRDALARISPTALAAFDGR
ncbi:MAG: STAS domain-containing protein [Candidatus Rokubacteria bacterium]|nr:STAS domain-containing protein [Candidatus Rokubacteria bacterium]